MVRMRAEGEARESQGLLNTWAVSQAAAPRDEPLESQG